MVAIPEGLAALFRGLHQAAAKAARPPRRSAVDYRAAKDIEDLWHEIRDGAVIVEPAA